MLKGPHTIHNMNVALQVSDMQQGLLLHKQVEKSISAHLIFKLEKFFDSMHIAETIYIDALSIDAFNISVENLEYEFADQCFNQIEKKLVTEIAKKSSSTELKTPVDAFIYFLCEGSLPIWCAVENVKQLSDDILSANQDENKIQLFHKLRRLFKNSKDAYKRFIWQFDVEFISVILMQGAGISMTHMYEIEECISENSAVFYEKNRQSFTSKTIDYIFLDDAFTLSNLHNFILQLLSETAAAQLAFTPDFDIQLFYSRAKNITSHIFVLVDEGSFLGKENITSRTHTVDIKTKFNQKKNNFYYVKNAGLILIYPFIKQLFLQYELIDKQGAIFPENIHTCVQLVQYICIAEICQDETTLMLAKILCGINPEVPIKKEDQLTDEQKNACIDILLQAIEHWPALKNTSAIGFSNTFFNREGKLEEKDDTWILTVQHKTEDILLNRLPWSISVVKLPWMKKIMHINWNY